MEANGTVRCCHDCDTRVRVLGDVGVPGLTLVQRASDGELFVVPAEQVTPDPEEGNDD